MEDKQVINRPEISKVVIGHLAEAFDKSFITIQRWIEKDSDLLTTDKAKDVFKRNGIDWPVKKSA